MCGLVGFFSPQHGQDQTQSTAVLRQMMQVIQRRGPDHQGTWHNANGTLFFGHNRLAIIDLSPAGEQPMHSASGRFVMVYNGEIYNHLDLRAELESAGVKPAWRGHSDSETLLMGFEVWGVQETLKRCVGMFALALLDQRDNTLTLALSLIHI